jgi:hypothetical protein
MARRITTITTMIVLSPGTKPENWGKTLPVPV